MAVAVIAASLAEVRATTSGTGPATVLFEGQPGDEVRADRVALRIDGWHIEVDAVDASGSLPPEPRSGVAVARVIRRPRSSFSRYDHLIRWHAASNGLDWRLVTALVQEESAFKPTAVSAKGAIGLMQVRPIAAADVGETEFASPDDNIRTGVRYLKRLESMLAPASGRDGLALVLAAYNLGPAHVQDAQILARAYGFDPHRWDNAMALMLPLLEDPTFHRRLPSGYAQGRAAVTYVERILGRYERYKAEAGETPGLAGPPGQAASASG
jgi:hypothetical protein